MVGLNSFAGDVYQSIYQNVSNDNLLFELKNMTGYNSVSVQGRNFAITDRYAAASKTNFRAYWTDYFQKLGMDVKEFSFPASHGSVGESLGHNLEAVLPGKSADSVVIIVHYDSMGVTNKETENPAVDDDMTGMAITLETARLLAPLKGHLDHTVRFVAADYEEEGGLEGARQYAQYISNLSKQQNFKIISAVDNEQSGWNCSKDGLCSDTSKGDVVDVFTCSGDTKGFNYPELSQVMGDIATKYSQLKTNIGCIGDNSDHYAMWEIGVPALVYSEHDPFNNPHFDQNGGDTFDTIDLNYFYQIAHIGVTYAATLVGISE